MALTRCVDSIYASQAAGDCHSGNLSEYEVPSRLLDSFGGRKKERLMEEIKKKRKRYGGGAKLMVGFNLPGDRERSVTRRLPKQANGPPFFYFENVARAPKGVWDTFSRFLYDIEPEIVDSLHFCATARKRGYIHNLPIGNRFPLRPLPPKTIFEAFPHYKKWWPSWDRREQLNCLLTSVASAALNERIHYALASSSDPPPPNVQNYGMRECRKGNLVWVGKNKVAPLEPNEMEYLLGFPRDHTRGVSNTKRYQCLGNSFQVDTVAYHLSVLKDIFPNGVNVLSLFTGIGGGEVALHRLGIHMRAVVSVEICEVNRRILRGWWDQTQTGKLIEIDDVETFNDDIVASFVCRFGGFDLVIGGSPCNNLAGRNRHTRDGLEGDKSFLFHHYGRILSAVKLAMGR
uniref:Uncharacterized protein n=1 Tax=Avena sativa TaxID=4498 RepID=A0ACD5Y6I1_AVESA